MIPDMTHFEKQNFHPLLRPQSADRKTSDEVQRFFCTSYFLKYYYFGHIYIVLVRSFHILPIDGGYYTAL
jgi:hypothetical protein